MNDPNQPPSQFSQPPIPDPFYTPPASSTPPAMTTPGAFAPGFGGMQAPTREWRDAPSIVKGGAYPLSWLAIVVLTILFGVIAAGFNTPNSNDLVPESSDPVERVVYMAIYGLLLGVNIWLNRALKKGFRAAWVVQIILSVLGLLSFPVGTLIHAYLLSQWFKPETKAWFGRS